MGRGTWLEGGRVKISTLSRGPNENPQIKSKTFNINFWEEGVLETWKVVNDLPGAAHSNQINQSSPVSRNREYTQTHINIITHIKTHIQHHIQFEITCSASTRDLVKFDITQTETVKSPEGCSDIRRAP